MGQFVEDGILYIWTVVLRSDFTFTQTAFVPAIGMTMEVSGTFSVTGNIVTFTFIGGMLHGETDIATVAGDTMTYIDDGFVLTLTRQ